MSYYGPSCDSNNKLFCATFTTTTCELTTTLNIQGKAQQGGESPVQNKYCFASSDECKNNILQKNFYCQNNSLHISSKQE